MICKRCWLDTDRPCEHCDTQKEKSKQMELFDLDEYKERIKKAVAIGCENAKKKDTRTRAIIDKNRRRKRRGQ